MPPGSFAHKVCCRRLPRCRDCPVQLVGELRALQRALEQPVVPAHLAGVPTCLHRYEPLLKRAHDTRQAQLRDSSA